MADKTVKIGVLTTISKTMEWFVTPSMRNLAKNGYDVTLICNMEKGFAEKNEDYAKCIHLPMSRGTSIKDLFVSIRTLRKIFRRERFDVLYYMSPNASMYASIAGWLAGVKIRIYNQTGIRYVTLTGIKRFVFKQVEKLTCLFSTHIKAVSFKNREFAVQEKLCPKNKISVVGIGGTIGVELEKCKSFDHTAAKQKIREKYGIAQNAFVFGYVGRVNEDKGINELIEAFLQLEKEHENLKLMLVGMLDDANPIREENLAIAQSNPNIVMTGNVPSEQVYAHMAAFDVLVHPTYREGFGKVLQEAMGVGIPIITTDIPGPSEVIENNISGILCRPKDVQDLKEKMILLFGDEALRKSFVQAGMRRAQTYFDRPIMLENILKDMNQIVGK